MGYKLQEGFVLWMTGLSQSGKTTLAKELEKLLGAGGVGVERLDGDVVRQSLSKDLGFSRQDRNTNIERVTYVARLLSRNRVAVLVSFISPYREQRERARKNVTNFIEVFVNAPLSICEERDTKGLYKKARRGEIGRFTGITDVYEEPLEPDVEVKTDKLSVEECAGCVLEYLVAQKYITCEERVRENLAT